MALSTRLLMCHATGKWKTIAFVHRLISWTVADLLPKWLLRSKYRSKTSFAFKFWMIMVKDVTWISRFRRSWRKMMAIVPNLANVGPFVVPDKPLTTPNRSNAGPPATAQYAGEIVYDSTAKSCIIAMGS